MVVHARLPWVAHDMAGSTASSKPALASSFRDELLDLDSRSPFGAELVDLSGYSSAAQALTDAVLGFHAYAAAVGASRRSLRRLQVGSTANQLIKRVSCPVIVVP